MFKFFDIIDLLQQLDFTNDFKLKKQMEGHRPLHFKQ